MMSRQQGICLPIYLAIDPSWKTASAHNMASVTEFVAGNLMAEEGTSEINPYGRPKRFG